MNHLCKLLQYSNTYIPTAPLQTPPIFQHIYSDYTFANSSNIPTQMS